MSSSDEIEASLELPEAVLAPVIPYRLLQDEARGDWRSPRLAQQPDAPWPAADNPVLRYLVVRAEESVKAGMELRTALLQLGVHAWFEGGIENYDRGRQDAERPR